MKNFAAWLFMLMLVGGGLTACGVNDDRTVDRDVERNVEIDRDKDGRMDAIDND